MVVCDAVEHVRARDVVTVEQLDCGALGFAENRNQNVGESDLLLAARADVEYGTLQHALQTERRLHFEHSWQFTRFFEPPRVRLIETRRRGPIEMPLQILLEIYGVAAARAQDLAHLGTLEHCQQEVLGRQVSVAGFPCPLECTLQAVFNFVGEHWASSAGS